MKNSEFDEYNCGLESPVYVRPKDADLLDEVSEEWGFEQLSLKEINDYTFNVAMAAHIGSFIHKGMLVTLRNELPNINGIEWFEVKAGEKHPVINKKHHTIDELTAIHVDLANLHREYEQKVNYIKAKVKDLVSEKNAEIHKENQIRVSIVNDYNKTITADYSALMKEYNGKIAEMEQTFEKEKNEKIKEASKLRIVVNPRYKTLVDEYLKKDK